MVKHKFDSENYTFVYDLASHDEDPFRIKQDIRLFYETISSAKRFTKDSIDKPVIYFIEEIEQLGDELGRFCETLRYNKEEHKDLRLVMGLEDKDELKGIAFQGYHSSFYMQAESLKLPLIDD